MISSEQLAGRRIAVVRSSVAEAYVKSRHPGARLMPFAALERKEADAMAGFAGLGLGREKVLHRAVCEQGQCAY